MDIWSQLANGPMFARLVQQASEALGQRYADTRPMSAVLTDARASEILPRFGFTLRNQSRPAWTSAGPPQFWERDHWPYVSLWSMLTGLLPDVIAHAGQEDGSVVQRITSVAIEELWNAQRKAHTDARKPIDHESAPYYLAAMLASLPGPAWMRTADGTAVERRLPAQPFRFPPSNMPLPLQLKNGLLLDVLCWAVLPPDTYDNAGPVAEIVYLSPVGAQKKLKAAWALLMDKKREILRLPDDNDGRRSALEFIAARRIDGKGMYVSHWNDAPLPESGLAHLVIQHFSVHKPRTGLPFLHMTGIDGIPNLKQFYTQMDIASPYPLQPTWAPMLWEQGQAQRLIVRLPSRGCGAFWVRTDDPKWAQIVARCAGGDSDVQIETFGEVQTRAAVAEVMHEDDT